MTRVLLTGGSGFIAAHTLDLLLKNGHSVVTTVRSQDKIDRIKKIYPDVGKDKLDFVIVPDIAVEGAFNEAVVSTPPFEAVLHTASPFHFNVTDIQKQLIDPAVIGTTGILRAIKKNAPTIKHVVITSSFAAIVNPEKMAWPGHTYSEADWNPMTLEDIKGSVPLGYRASKTFAEKAAWKYVEDEKPGFTLSTVNPPMVFGPIINHLQDLDNLNTSNQRIRDAALGKFKDEIPDSGVTLWVDVRNVAQAHVAAFEKPEAAGKRFFTTQGTYNNKQICQIIKKNFPQYKDLPTDSTPGGDYGEAGPFTADNSRSVEVLGLKYIPLEQSIVDCVKSLQSVGL
ncbi:dihydroflavonol-4-reductase [Lophium mytilinum]|uniref:Dihydroflavonol-4-reductase n=1 Tax=Lophium mytilinum TaxID=390894 RepID=A0A6A6RBB6_9PEZI|nr:dihydroflavonol-4-reductase [Lophium mytilinum]